MRLAGRLPSGTPDAYNAPIAACLNLNPAVVTSSPKVEAHGYDQPDSGFGIQK